jgi:putative protease
MPDEPKKIGQVTHYYNKISVAIISLSRAIKTGDAIQIQGKNTDFTQTVDSMQYDHKDLPRAKKGQEVGIKVDNPVHEGDQVFLIE